MTRMQQAGMKRKHATRMQQVNMKQKRTTLMQQVDMTAEVILSQSLKVIQGEHMKQKNVFLRRKNNMEHIAFRRNHSVVLSILSRINGMHPA